MSIDISGMKRSPLKDRPLHYPGQSLDEEINGVRFDIFGYVMLALLLFGIAFIESWRWYFAQPPQPVIAVCVAGIVVSYSFWKIRGLQKQIASLKLGRDGERVVGQALEDLRRKGYAVFHDIEGENFNVDHVVVSPKGIFAIETKTYSKPARGQATVTFDGKRVMLVGKRPDEKPVQQVIANAKWISNVLRNSTGREYAVTPVLVFPGWWVNEKCSTEHVWVLNPGGLPHWISREADVITEEALHMAAFHLARFATASTKAGSNQQVGV